MPEGLATDSDWDRNLLNCISSLIGQMNSLPSKCNRIISQMDRLEAVLISAGLSKLSQAVDQTAHKML